MNNNDKKGPSKDSKNLKFYAIYFVAILIMVTVFNYFMNDIRNKRQNYNEFYAALQEDRIQEITLDESTRTYIYTMKEGDELAGLQLYTGMISGDEEILAIDWLSEKAAVVRVRLRVLDSIFVDQMSRSCST